MISFKTFKLIIESKLNPISTNIRSEYIPKKELNDVQIANSTSRKSGAIGDKAIVPRYIRQNSDKNDKILDFGAGKHATHANNLRKDGYNVTAHEFGKNKNDNHDKNALKNKYHTTYASNVLNTQSSPRMLGRTLWKIHKSTSDKLVANLPKEPRKSNYLTADNVGSQIKKFYNKVETPKVVDGSKINKQAPLFVGTEPKETLKAKLKSK